MRIHGVDVNESKDEDDVMNMIEECYSQVNALSDKNNINCHHRIGLYLILVKIRGKNEIDNREILLMLTSSIFL